MMEKWYESDDDVWFAKYLVNLEHAWYDYRQDCMMIEIKST